MKPMTHMKRTLAALGLAGAALALAPAAHAAGTTEESVPGADAVSQIMELTDDPNQTLAEAQTAFVAADESIGTAAEGAFPAVAGPLGAVAESLHLAG
ncbi:hypothetical protein LG634_27050 [Streptomyces bambusae]|uniref:hypothetical protein n=1 Tax=Streptomyces bambusae TaxID=1550616 RepID=UPI001CFCBCC0|nr:hypothetical protein [Streptomyces bambusae]MCB5168468.1 hypothetical protein [Streptomyces bambusae]